MKKWLIICILLSCVALFGCGNTSTSTNTSTDAAQSAEEFLNELEVEMVAIQEADEQQHQAELEAEYPEGILPAGKYRREDNSVPYFCIGSFDASYDAETGKGMISHGGEVSQIGVLEMDDFYQYDAETGLFTFSLVNPYTYNPYYNSLEQLLTTFCGYYNEDDDSFTIIKDINFPYRDERTESEEGYSLTLYRQ